MISRKRSHDHEPENQDRLAKVHKIADDPTTPEQAADGNNVESVLFRDTYSSLPFTVVESSEMSTPDLKTTTSHKSARDYASEYSDSEDDDSLSKITRSIYPLEVSPTPVVVSSYQSPCDTTTDKTSSTSSLTSIDASGTNIDSLLEGITKKSSTETEKARTQPTEKPPQSPSVHEENPAEKRAHKPSVDAKEAALSDEPNNDSEYELDLVVNANAKSKLIPLGTRKMAVLGIKDESLLRMLCKHSDTGKKQEQHFRKIVHTHIDWNNKSHIIDINGWRTQLYGRAGMGTKIVYTFHPDEVAWFELYYNMALVMGRKIAIRLPPHKDICLQFNEFFDGKILQDENGNNMKPRVVRKLTSVTPKATRIRERYAHLEADKAIVKSKAGKVFSPKITQKMLDSFKEKRKALPTQVVNGKPGKVNSSKAWNDLYASFLDPEDLTDASEKRSHDGDHSEVHGDDSECTESRGHGEKRKALMPASAVQTQATSNAPKVTQIDVVLSLPTDERQKCGGFSDNKSLISPSKFTETIEVTAPVLVRYSSTSPVLFDQKAVLSSAKMEPRSDLKGSVTISKNNLPVELTTAETSAVSARGEEYEPKPRHVLTVEKKVDDRDVTYKTNRHAKFQTGLWVQEVTENQAVHTVAQLNLLSFSKDEEHLKKSPTDHDSEMIVPIDAQSNPSDFSFDEEIPKSTDNRGGDPRLRIENLI